MPPGASSSSQAINFQLNKAQTASVFGVTKLRGGSMYAKFEVCSMSVSYRPRENILDLSYKMNDYF